MTEDKGVGWHPRLNGHEFEQAPGVGDGHGSLACCSSWGWKELDMIATELTDYRKRSHTCGYRKRQLGGQRTEGNWTESTNFQLQGKYQGCNVQDNYS